jgi:CBS domain-containing protein
MKTVRELLNMKGHDIVSVTPDTMVFDALALMARKNIGAVLVIDAHARLVGILSERDYARKIILKGHASKETPVASIMTEKVMCISADKSVEECMALMTTGRFRHLPVMDNDQLSGVVSIGDVGRAIISNQGFVIEQLERYIWGTR